MLWLVEKPFYDQPVTIIKKHMKTWEKLLLAKEILRNWLFIRLSFFKESYKTIALDLSKQQALDADPRSIPRIIVKLKEI